MTARRARQETQIADDQLCPRCAGIGIEADHQPLRRLSYSPVTTAGTTISTIAQSCRPCHRCHGTGYVPKEKGNA